MALSEDAKGIIAEIRAQANTTRHKSEEYSIKAIRVDLKKFQGVFDAMNDNLTKMASVADKEAAEAQARADRAAALDLLSETEKKKLAKDQANREKRENTLKNRDLALREKEMKKRERSDFKIFGKDGIFSSLFSGAFNLIKKALFVGIAGSFIYELAAGFLERFGIELPTIAEAAGKFSDLATSVDWESLKKNLNALAAEDIGALVGTTVAGYGAMKAIPLIGEGIQTISIMKILEKMMSPDSSDVDTAGRRAGRFGLKAIRVGIAGLIFTGLATAMPVFEDIYRKYVKKMSDQDIANARVDGVDIGGNVITSLAGLFVPGGPYVKLAAVLGLFLFKTLSDFITDRKNLDSRRNAVKDLERQRTEMDKKIDEAIDLEQQLLNGGYDPATIRKRLAELRAKRKEMNSTSLEEFQQEVNDAQSELTRLQTQLKNLDPTDTRFTQETFTVATAAGPVTSTVEVSEQEARERFAAEQQRLLGLIETRKEQITDIGQVLSEYKIAPEDLGLVQIGEEFITQTALAAQREERRAKESEMKMVNAYNERIAGSTEMLIKGPVENLQDILDRTSGFDYTAGGPVSIQLSQGGNQIYQSSSTNQSASTVTNFGAGIEMIDTGMACAFPGGVSTRR